MIMSVSVTLHMVVTCLCVWHAVLTRLLGMTWPYMGVDAVGAMNGL